MLTVGGVDEVLITRMIWSESKRRVVVPKKGKKC